MSDATPADYPCDKAPDTDRPPAPRPRACYYCNRGPVFITVPDRPPICVDCHRQANRLRERGRK